MPEFSTPMMQQYMAIKAEHPDCLLFFRLGDFYELFLDDAKIGARVLDITLTRRPRGKDGDIPMAGVPFHAADSYIAKLVKAGFKVAICEQTSEPNGRGVVDRAVIRIITAGTMFDEKSLKANDHNYVIGISVDGNKVGIAALDISTGDFSVSEYINEDRSATILNELHRLAPAECIVSPELYDDPEFLKICSEHYKVPVSPFIEWNKYADNATTILKDHFKIKSLRTFGLEGQTEAVKAAAGLLGYSKLTQKGKIGHITSLRTEKPAAALGLDGSTITNLELFETLHSHDERGSLIDALDATKSAAGGRMLRHWLRYPLQSKKDIERRLDAVEWFATHNHIRKHARELLGSLYDLERTIGRLSVGLSSPLDLKRLWVTIDILEKLEPLFKEKPPALIKESIEALEPIKPLASYIKNRIVDDPPFESKEGGIIRPNVDPELDNLRDSIKSSTTWIAELEQKERNRTGIPTLKVKFNSVFGYYIEVSRSYVNDVPAEYMRKQTTVNAERFITPELEEHEQKVLRGETDINKREYALFLETVAHVLSHTVAIQKAASAAATIDCLQSAAEIASHERYTRPTITTELELKIDDGRHPVVERQRDISFVPNSTLLNDTDHQLIVITGPNMAGKSVYMRQVALIVLMAHIGYFVPAKRAQIPLTDRIFVRSGASDNIGRGLSTFMVEMVETAFILRHASSRSLIIMDEIGRGTSTYDGISIAWAIAEYLVTESSHRPKTLFATHYHELQDLEKQHSDHIKNYHMAIEEAKQRPVFLYRVIRGGAEGSYAIAVAELAGIPEKVTSRAKKLLEGFNSDNTV